MAEQYLQSNNGRLFFDNCDLTALAHEYKTPLFVYSKKIIEDNINNFKSALTKFYPNSIIQYASKAFCCKEIYRIIAPLGLQADVVSTGEMHTAITAGFDPAKIYFHGNNKTVDDLSFALLNNIGCFVADSGDELALLGQMAAAVGKRVRVMLRIKPMVEAHTHEAVITGNLDSKFGLSTITQEAQRAFVFAVQNNNIELVGLHCHIGSQIFDTEPFCIAAQRLLDFALIMKDKTGHSIKQLNLGGGFGIKYTDEDDPKPHGDYITAIADTINNFCTENNFSPPQLIIEPGRAIVANACVTLYTVGGIKEIEGVRNYVSVDGGMADNPRYALYKSRYDMRIANAIDKAGNFLCAVAGRCCESGDLLGDGILIPRPVIGDVLCVLCTGAYNYSMASNYNRLAKPAVLLIENGKTRIIINRQTHDDLTREDL